MANEETIARATIQLGADGSKLSPEMAAAVARAQAILDGANKKTERAAAQTARAIQREIDKINATRPTKEMAHLEQAVAKLGGTSALTKDQLKRVTVEVNALAAAGAKVPASLSKLTGVGGKLSAAFTSLTTGGGIHGALAAIGPAGLAAATGVGALTLGVTKAVTAVRDLASKAEGWGNIAMATGISVESVQKLGDFLEDAGFQAGDLEKIMKNLQTEIATGGKGLEKYGINVKALGLESMSAEEQLQAIAKAITSIEDPMVRGAAATEAFGKSGARSLQAIAGIAQGAYKDLAALSEKQVSDLQTVDQQLDELARAYENFAKRAIVALLGVGKQGPGLPVIDNSTPEMGAGTQIMAGQMPWSALARISNPATFLDTSPLTLGPDEALTLAKLAKQREKEKVEALEEQKKKQAEIKELLEKQLESARQLAFEILKAAEAKVPPIATTFGGVGFLPQARSLGMGAMVGAQNFDFGIDAQGFVTWGDAAKDVGIAAEDAGKKTATWEDRLGSLADQLQTLANTTGGLTGKIVSFAASLATGLGGAISGFKAMTAPGKGLMGFLGKASGALGLVGSAVGVVGGLIGGIKSLFGGKSKEQKAAEAAAKKQAEEERRQAKIQAAEEKKQGLLSAKGFAESLMDRLAAGGLSEGLTKALQVIVGKVGDALLKSGLGILDQRLRTSKEFQGAQGLAGDVAGALGAMRQAGMGDAGLLAAGGAAAVEIQRQAVDAALAAGLSPEEAAKAGSAAIAPILREQLNASLQSGKELDANTKALLEEAKKNGIDILADPAIESLGVQREQLGVLKEIAGKRGGQGDTNAARGFGPMITPNLGGGLGPRIQTHPGELAMVIPRSRMGPNGIISAAGGLFTTSGTREGGRDRESDRQREAGGGRDAGGGGGGETGAPGTGAGAPGAAAIEELKARMAELRPVSITTNIAPQITEDPLATKERKEDLRRFTIDQIRGVLKERDPETMFLLNRALGRS